MPDDPASAWDGLEEPWRVCLSLAWEAYAAGTIPVGAALVALDPERRYEDHVLYTALEPCVLCVGATVMATVGRIRYAGADPYGGGDGGPIGVNPHVELVPLQLEGPRDDAFGVLASALLPAFFLRREPGGHVVRAFRERTPRIVAVAGALLEARAPERAAAGVALPDALPDLWRALETTS